MLIVNYRQVSFFCFVCLLSRPDQNLTEISFCRVGISDKIEFRYGQTVAIWNILWKKSFFYGINYFMDSLFNDLLNALSKTKDIKWMHIQHSHMHLLVVNTRPLVVTTTYCAFNTNVKRNPLLIALAALYLNIRFK